MKEEDPLKVYKNIDKRLGEGASGIVYKGTDRKTNEVIALKVAPASDLKNLKNELALQRMCNHKNIVNILDCYLWNNKLWVGDVELWLFQWRIFNEGFSMFDF